MPPFPHFQTIQIRTAETLIHGVIGGQGAPVLLLHGWPQSHVEWHRVAPLLAQHFTVVATDLRGYGASGKPPSGNNHEGYAKRAMARDQVEVMQHLGFGQFMVVGHDRGGRVAHRMALDYPNTVEKLVVLDIAPTYGMYQDVSKDFASLYFHWFFLIQPAPMPETLLAGNGDIFLRNWLFRDMVPTVITEELFAEYARSFDDPATLHAMCEDYRAAATIDLEHDAADLDHKITCPLLALWGASGVMEQLYDVLAMWRQRAVHVQGKPMPGGHWLPEQRPNELYAELLAFLR